MARKKKKLKEFLDTEEIVIDRRKCSKEEIHARIEKDLRNHKTYRYKMLDDVQVHDKDDKKIDVMEAVVGDALSLALLYEEFEWVQKMLKEGVEVHLDSRVRYSTFRKENGEKDREIVISLMEIICSILEVPDILYNALWERAKKAGSGQLNNLLLLAAEFGEDRNQIAIPSIKRLRKQWEEAAQKLLIGWIRVYRKHYNYQNTEIWMELFEQFPDMGEVYMPELFGRVDILRDEDGKASFPQYWDMYTKCVDDFSRQKTLLHLLSLNEVGLYSSYGGGGKMVLLWKCLRKEHFGEQLKQERDTFVRRVIRSERVCMEEWRCIYESDILPKEYIDVYLEMVETSKNKQALPWLVKYKFGV